MRGVHGPAPRAAGWGPFRADLRAFRADLLALLAIVLATVALVPQTVLLGKLPDNVDYWLQEYVHLAFLHRALHGGELPLWNGQLGGGTPHLADPQASVLYPITTLSLLLLSPAWVARLTIPLHFVMAGAFTYGYARRLSLTRPAALTAGLFYALAPHFAPLSNATYLQQSGAWVPAILWAVHAGATGRRPGMMAVAGVLWALQLLRGYPQTWYMTGLVAGTYWAVVVVARAIGAARASRWGKTSPPSPLSTQWTGGGAAGGEVSARIAPRTPALKHAAVDLAGGLVLAAVGLGLGAAQLVPSLTLLGESQRSGGFSLVESSTRGAVSLANFLGAAGPDAEVTGAFPGGVALGLALLALLTTWRERLWAPAALAAAGLALSLGSLTPLWGIAYRLIPGFHTLHMPHRTLFLWSLGLALLAGSGADALARRPVAPVGRLRALLIAGGGAALVAWLSVRTPVDPSPDVRRGASQLLIGLAVVAALAWTAGLRRAGAGGAPAASGAAQDDEGRTTTDGGGFRPSSFVLRPRWPAGSRRAGEWLEPVLASLAPALVAADLLAYSLPRLHGEFYPPGAVYAPPAPVRWLLQRAQAAGAAGPYRFASQQYRPAMGEEGDPRLQDGRRVAYLPPNVSAVYPDLYAAQGYLAIHLTGAEQFFSAVNDLGPQPRILSVFDPQSRLIDLFGIRYFLTDATDTFTSIVGGGQSLIAADRPAVVVVREPHETAALVLRSNLGDSVDVADGEPVGELTLETVDGREISLVVRAGEHTAEWLYDDPRVAGTVRHRKAPIASTSSRGGYGAHVYLASFDLAPYGHPQIRAIRVRALDPRARLNVQRLDLVVPLATRFDLAYAGGPVRIWENPAALPWAWWVPGYRVEAEVRGTLERLRDPSFDFQAEAILAAPLDRPLPAGAPPAAPANARTAVERITANTRVVTVDAPRAGLLVVREVFAPGWRAWVDGVPAPLVRADSVFQAVPVPAGTHRVEFRYRPASVTTGFAISALAGLCLAAWASLSYPRRRRGAPPAGP